ncbi:unnamed protein product [Phaedon cochleariae]|uniref:Serine palmitoyltransferase small subunit A n=1 Tax=Phaedon cochleariae TaxID=80249 RepID=A0A9P0GWG2_PHACE|nr:unnamed protein product [Phaedon cochleariae]
MLKSVGDFIGYWYFRYLLVTELYMVEKWERAMFHILLFLFLTILYTFNNFVVLGSVEKFMDSTIFTAVTMNSAMPHQT